MSLVLIQDLSSFRAKLDKTSWKIQNDSHDIMHQSLD
jgi:hypothetical protein